MKKALVFLIVAVIMISIMSLSIIAEEAEAVTEATEATTESTEITTAVTEATTETTGETEPITFFGGITNFISDEKAMISVLALAGTVLGLAVKVKKGYDGLKTNLVKYGNATHTTSLQATETLTNVDKVLKEGVDALEAQAKEIRAEAEKNGELLAENIKLKQQLIEAQSKNELRDTVLAKSITAIANMQNILASSINISQARKDDTITQFNVIQTALKDLRG